MAKLALMNGLGVFRVETDFPFALFNKDSLLNKEFVKDRKPIMILSADNDVDQLEWYNADPNSLSQMIFIENESESSHYNGEDLDDYVALFREVEFNDISTEGKKLSEIMEELEEREGFDWGTICNMNNATTNNKDGNIMGLEFYEYGYSNTFIVIFEGFDLSKIKFLDVEGEDRYSIGNWMSKQINKDEKLKFNYIDENTFQNIVEEKKRRLEKLFS